MDVNTMAAERLASSIELESVVRCSARHSGPTEEQWRGNKETIRELYLVQKMPLIQVMAFMRTRHGFYATPKMYKMRFAKWQFRKNNNLRDMTTRALRIKQNGMPEIDVKMETDWKEIERYFKRRGNRSIENVIGDSSTRSSSAESPSNRSNCGTGVQENDDQAIWSHAHDSGANSHAIASVQPWNKTSNTLDNGLANTPARSRSPMAGLYVALTTMETVLKMISIYYTGSCETKMWYTSEGGRFQSRTHVPNAATLLDCFVTSWKLGLDLAIKGFHRRSQRTLQKACRHNAQIIIAEHPSTVRALLEMLLTYSRAGLHELANAVLKVFVTAAPAQHHPLAILCRQLLQVEPEAAEQIAMSAMSCAVETLSVQCSNSHYTVVRCNMALLEHEGQRRTPGYIVQKSARIREAYLVSPQFSQAGYFNVAESQVSILCGMGEFAEAERVLEEMQACAAQFAPPAERRWAVKCADLLSEVQFRQGKFELAERNCRYCIEARGDGLPDKLADARSVACATRLSEWLRLWNRGEEALEIERMLI